MDSGLSKPSLVTRLGKAQANKTRPILARFKEKGTRDNYMEKAFKCKGLFIKDSPRTVGISPDISVEETLFQKNLLK